MSQVSHVLRKTTEGYTHWCPGCKEAHHIRTERLDHPRWDFNGNVERPTFRPSVRIFITRPDGSESTLCHYFITEGLIEFCTDCRHDLASQTVPLPLLSDAGRRYAWGDE
jgi:Family of unknown function (DUF6527)